MIRIEFEEREIVTLAQYAVKSRFSHGRQYQEEESPNRTCFQRDRDRIIHAKAFRRLKHKTQVFVAAQSDHYRSRLTHTLEVAQISRHLARLLYCNEDLSEAIALAHDLGHTPFGHSGERELNDLMRHFGGFEHNRQSRRIVDELELKYPMFPGLNLTLEVREGLIKHETPWDKTRPQKSITTLEAQIVNVADEIAYNNHDLDDGLRSGILEESELESQLVLWREAKAHICSRYSNLSATNLTTLINSYLIAHQIEDVYQTTQENIAKTPITSVEDIQKITEPIVTFSTKMKEKNQELRRYLFDRFYSHYQVYRMNKKGQIIIRKLFEAFMNDICLLPLEYQEKIKSGQKKERVCCDYIAGMTDTFAMKEYETLYS